MRIGFWIGLFGLLFGFSFAQDFVSDQVIVQYSTAHTDYSLLGNLDPLSTLVVGLSGETVQEAVARFSQDPDVLHVQPNYLYDLSSLPNDPYFSYMWGLYNSGQQLNGINGTSGSDIDRLRGIEIFSGVDNVAVTGTLVGILDNGTAYNHPELSGRMWNGINCLSYLGSPLGSCLGGYDFWDDDLDPYAFTGGDMSSQNWHGTFVAGILGAEYNNAVGIDGVNPNIRLMSLRAGSGNSLSTSTIVQAISFATYNGAKILNASFGGSSFDQQLYDAMQDFPGLIVAAAGNTGLEHTLSGYHSYPCDFDLTNVICVGASDQSDGLTSFSDYGTAYVDIVAPGTTITSTSFSGNDSTIYGYRGGTSFATPYVVGVASLLWSYAPKLTVTQVRNVILGYSDYISDLSGTIGSSSRLNLYNVLDALSLSGSFATSGSLESTGIHILMYSSKYPVGYTISGTGLQASYTGILLSSGTNVPVLFSTGDGYKYLNINLFTGYANRSSNTGLFVHNSMPTITLGVVSGHINYGTSFTLTGTLSDGYFLSGLYINGTAYTGCNFTGFISTCVFSSLYILGSGYNQFTLTGYDSDNNLVSTGISIFVDLYDRIPNNIAFVSQANSELNTIVLSSVVTLSGIDLPVSISVTNGSYAINGGGFVTTTGTISAGDALQLRLTSSSSYGTAKSVSVTIGSSIFSFTVTTKSAPAGGGGGGGVGGGGGGGGSADSSSEQTHSNTSGTTVTFLSNDDTPVPCSSLIIIPSRGVSVCVPPFLTQKGVAFKTSLISLFTQKLSSVSLSQKEENTYLSAFNTFLMGLYLYMEDGVMQKSTILDAFATLKPLLVTNQESELDKAVSYLHIKSITKFTTSDTFRVNDSLSRQEAAKLLVLFVKNVMGQDADVSSCSFTDITQTDASLYPFILQACDLKLFKGVDGKFYPFESINKAQAVVVVLRAIDQEPSQQNAVWYKPYIDRAYNLGLLRSSTLDGAGSSITRGTMALLLYRAAQLIEQ